MLSEPTVSGTKGHVSVPKVGSPVIRYVCFIGIRYRIIPCTIVLRT